MTLIYFRLRGIIKVLLIIVGVHNGKQLVVLHGSCLEVHVEERTKSRRDLYPC